jgi:hypothetical protein
MICECIAKENEVKFNIELSEDEVVILINSLKARTEFYFNNCTQSWVDDEWCVANGLMKKLEVLVE